MGTPERSFGPSATENLLNVTSIDDGVWGNYNFVDLGFKIGETRKS